MYTLCQNYVLRLSLLLFSLSRDVQCANVTYCCCFFSKFILKYLLPFFFPS